ncbi:MAG: DUF2184 domain-containing protein [bacterium]|nr:DUF2184 domain-containing protein [bacterium]
MNRLDAVMTYFTEKELEHQKCKLLKIDLPEISVHRRLIPVSYDTPAGAESISYDEIETIGKAVTGSLKTTNIPNSTVIRRSYSYSPENIMAAYEYTVDEIDSARLSGKNLPQARLFSAKESLLIKEKNLVMFGKANTDMYGLLNNPSVPSLDVADNGSGSTKWKNKTPNQIIDDITNMFTTIKEETKLVEFADTLLVPVSQYNMLLKPRSDSSDTTIMNLVLNAVPELKTIMPIYDCKGAGEDDKNIAFAYRRNPYKLEMDILLDSQILPVQWTNFVGKVPMRTKFGGVKFYKPLSAMIGVGI